MLTKSNPPPEQQTRVARLAKRLESDIRRKGLRVGDEYMTADGVSSLLGVSRMMANRAMNVLAERQVLVRHRSRGTFVGPSVESCEVSLGKCIHFLSFIDHSPDLHIPLNDILGGLQQSFPELSLKTHLVPLRNALQYVRMEFEQAPQSQSLGGIILALGTREVQQYFADSGLPVVVSGSVYPGIHLPSIDVDQKQFGFLLAEQALSAGHQRLVFVGRELWRRGDNLAFEGVQEAAHAAGLGHNGVMVRNISSTPSAVADEIDHLLDEIALPASLICRVPYHARTAAEAAKRRGLRVPDDLNIIYDSVYEETAMPPFPTVRCRASWEEYFARVGKMLAQLNNGVMPEPRQVIIPVEKVPASNSSETH